MKLREIINISERLTATKPEEGKKLDRKKGLRVESLRSMFEKHSQIARQRSKTRVFDKFDPRVSKNWVHMLTFIK